MNRNFPDMFVRQVGTNIAKLAQDMSQQGMHEETLDLIDFHRKAHKDIETGTNSITTSQFIIRALVGLKDYDNPVLEEYVRRLVAEEVSHSFKKMPIDVYHTIYVALSCLLQETEGIQDE